MNETNKNCDSIEKRREERKREHKTKKWWLGEGRKEQQQQQQQQQPNLTNTYHPLRIDQVCRRPSPST